MSETPKRTLKDILSQHLDETLREILALERYGAKVREACATYLLGHIEKLISDGGRASPTDLANVVLAAPLPPIEGEARCDGRYPVPSTHHHAMIRSRRPIAAAGPAAITAPTARRIPRSNVRRRRDSRPAKWPTLCGY
jgi:hypothetical protein